MTTKTKAGPVAEVERLEAIAEKARQEAGELGKRARTQRAQRHNFDLELAKLAANDPEQFDASGSPLPGSDASKLRASITKLDQSQLGAVAEGAQARVGPAEDAVARAVDAHADVLSREEYEQGGKHAVELLQRGAALIAEGHAAYQQSEDRQRRYVIAVAGLDGQDIVSDPRAAEVARIASDLDGLTPPRSKSLTPLESESRPRKIRARSGGFVEAGHLRGEDIHPQQPQKVAA